MAKTKAEIQRDYRRRSGDAAGKKYQAANVKRFGIALNLNTDADIIAKLDSVPNKQGFIKESIRKNM